MRGISWLRTHLDAFGDDVARGFHDLYTWVDREGREVWYYISHPGKLVDLIWDDLISKLEGDAWNVGDKLGKFLLSLILHNIKRFALLVEDIVHAVL